MVSGSKIGRIWDAVTKALFFVAIIVGWQLFVEITRTPKYLIPTPVDSYNYLISNNQIMLVGLSQTLVETFAGFALAILVGFALAIAIVYSRYLRSTLYPALVAFNAFPKVLLAPLFLIWFGLGYEPKIVLAFIFSFFPITVNVATGLGEIDPRMIDLARIMKASKFQIFTKIRLPHSIEYFFDGLIIAFPIALVGTVIGELIGGNLGLGYLVSTATQFLNTTEMFAAFVLMIIVAVGFYYLLVLARRYALRWKQPGNEP